MTDVVATTPTLVDVTKANDDLAERLVATIKNLAGRLHANNQCVEEVVTALESAHAGKKVKAPVVEPVVAPVAAHVEAAPVVEHAPDLPPEHQ